MKRTRKQFFKAISVLVIFLSVFVLSTAAFWYPSVTVERNLFRTGIVKINVNDGKPIIVEEEIFFEPGMSIAKDFFIKNEGTMDVYYRLYFEQVEGYQEKELEVEIKQGGTILWSGRIAELTEENCMESGVALRESETIWLTAILHIPESIGNDLQKRELLFDLCVEGVQTKNNPDRLFE